MLASVLGEKGHEIRQHGSQHIKYVHKLQLKTITRIEKETELEKEEEVIEL
jgi:hypothetical protein|tara:strand:+ start:241 stop:393 length:153 start_codon:yes stop_codon:yes gene_type:complete